MLERFPRKSYGPKLNLNMQLRVIAKMIGELKFIHAWTSDLSGKLSPDRVLCLVVGLSSFPRREMQLI